MPNVNSVQITFTFASYLFRSSLKFVSNSHQIRLTFSSNLYKNSLQISEVDVPSVMQNRCSFKNFAKFSRKQLWQSLFFVKLHQVSKLQLYLKRLPLLKLAYNNYSWWTVQHFLMITSKIYTLLLSQICCAKKLILSEAVSERCSTKQKQSARGVLKNRSSHWEMFYKTAILH